MKDLYFCDKLLLGMCRTLDHETSSLIQMSKLRMNEVKDQETIVTNLIFYVEDDTYYSINDYSNYIELLCEYFKNDNFNNKNINVGSICFQTLSEYETYAASEENMLSDILWLERLIKLNSYNKLLVIFDLYSVKYSAKIENWPIVSEENFKLNKFAINKEEIKKHALFILSLLKKYHGDVYMYEDEKEELKMEKAKIDLKIKQLSEKKVPYLLLSMSISFIVFAIIFLLIPKSFGNKILMYHLSGFMLLCGLTFIDGELKVRKSLGFYGYSDKINSKRIYFLLIQSFAYMIPVSIFYFFLSGVVFIKIMFIVQILFCLTVLINGTILLVVHSVENKKANILGVIFDVIGVASFVVEILQLFNIL